MFKDTVFGTACLVHDGTNPMIVFQFHAVLLRRLGLAGTYAVLPPRLLFWVQISVLVLLYSLVSGVLAVAIY